MRTIQFAGENNEWSPKRDLNSQAQRARHFECRVSANSTIGRFAPRQPQGLLGGQHNDRKPKCVDIGGRGRAGYRPYDDIKQIKTFRKISKEVDARLKAQEHAIDSVISGHEKELSTLLIILTES